MTAKWSGLLVLAFLATVAFAAMSYFSLWAYDQVIGIGCLGIFGMYLLASVRFIARNSVDDQ